ncbi:MAG TPA: single-stranded DNA-binding protein [Clostridiales bacterium]|nr:single-stranded DNA-binding protein [Clostridiales bacterium]
MNENYLKNNRVFLSGRVAREPQYSHELFGEGFYEFYIEVKRLSGQTDVLPVTVSERIMNGVELSEGSPVALSGQFRSYNKLENEHSKLMLTVFVRDFIPYDAEEQNPNVVELNGYICKPPVYRTTPFNREICDVLLAVNRGYNKSDYIPCIAWGRNARFVRDAEVGLNVVIGGRIQSRKYNKKLDDDTIEERVAYELSVGKISVERSAAEIASTVDPE